MRTRGLIEQAKGMLAERLGCDPESAFELLSTRSQETNTPLVQIAADVVAATPAEAPPPPSAETARPGEVGLPAGGRRPELHTITELDRRHDPPELSGTARRTLRLAIAAVNAAADPEELVRAIATVGMKGQAGAAVAIFFAEPDGALRLLACHGWPAQAASEWRRLPSSIDTAVGHAVRTGAPVLVDGHSKHNFVLIGPPVDVRLVFPLAVQGRVIGAIQFAWKSQRRLGQATRLYLSHLAVAAGRTLSRLWPKISGPSQELDWIRSVLEAVHGNAHLLTPVRNEAGEIVDFIIAAVSDDADEADRAALGRRLLDTYPQLAANGVFAGYVRALTGGQIWRRSESSEETIVHGRVRHVIVSRRASRLGGAVLASWERLDETLTQERHLARLEAFGGFGWGQWDLNSDDVRWSPGMYRLVGKESSREPASLESLVDLVDAADRPRMERFVAEALSGRDSVVDVRMQTDGSRWLRLFCEAPAAQAGHKSIHVLAQDVSDRYAREQHLRSVQSRAAAGRLRLASQQDLTARLVHLLYPKEMVSVSSESALVVGRHLVGESDQPLRADFCDAVELPDDRIMVLVGDTFGVGMTAAATAVRLVRPVIALALADTPLPRILDVINTDLHREADPALASLLVAVFDPRTGDFSFASAGHLPPIWLRRDLKTPRMLDEATGPALGLIEEPKYRQASVGLVSGDVIVCYTDGVIDQRPKDPLKSLATRLAGDYRSGGSQGLLDLTIAHHADEACICVMEVRRLKQPQSG